ncbi:MAG: acylglycerol kinase family protein, partial [Flavobacteriales bacterium]|nr:acylglycerol kinase family protein [Flavobacteriales bacterium]
MKIKFIVNPISGTGKQKNIERYINQYLDKNKFDYNISYTEKSEHAKEICKLAISEKYNIIIAVGGDGTVNEIASELIDTDITLGVIPCGSGNGFAYHIGMNKNIAKAVKQINNSDTQIIDSCTANGDKFINVSGIGFDAHI